MIELPERFYALDYGRNGVNLHDSVTKVEVSIDENKNYYRNREAAITILSDLITPIAFASDGYMISEGIIRKTQLYRWEFFGSLPRGVSIAMEYITARYIALGQLEVRRLKVEKEYTLSMKEIGKLQMTLESK